MLLEEIPHALTEVDPKHAGWYALPDGVSREEVACQLVLLGAVSSNNNQYICTESGNTIMAMWFVNLDDVYVIVKRVFTNFIISKELLP